MGCAGAGAGGAGAGAGGCCWLCGGGWTLRWAEVGVDILPTTTAGGLYAARPAAEGKIAEKEDEKRNADCAFRVESRFTPTQPRVTKGQFGFSLGLATVSHHVHIIITELTPRLFAELASLFPACTTEPCRALFPTTTRAPWTMTSRTTWPLREISTSSCRARGAPGLRSNMPSSRGDGRSV